jgi:hypothetical protein
MKEPTVSVGPVHHRRHAESMHGAEVYRVLKAVLQGREPKTL